MEPIILQLVPQDRYNKLCYICEEQGKESKASVGACMQCNKTGCKQYFHVTCAQAAGLLCEEAGNYMDNVKYCGYCHYHYQKLKKDSHIKTIPAFRPIPADNATPEPSPEKGPLKEKSRGKKLKADFQITEQGFHSDSSASTISDSSLNLEASRSDEPKSKRNDLTDTVTLAPAKVTSSMKENSCDNVKKSEGKSEDTDDMMEVTATSTGEFEFEDIVNGDMNSNSKSFDKTVDKRRVTGLLDEPDKKKPKHSRNKSRVTKNGSDPPFPSSDKLIPQIPIVRIKRKFNHDRSSSSHSVEKVSFDASDTYESVISSAESQPVSDPILTVSLKSEVQDTLTEPRENPPPDTVEIKLENPPLFEESQSVNPPVPLPDAVNLMSNVTKQSTGSADSVGSIQVPSSLEDLLEKQWVQTSNFLMEQAQHFDIASLITCLHELRSENNRLEKEVSELASRRDSLLAINARLKVLPSSENALTGGVPFSALSMLSSKDSFTGYMPYDNGVVHSTQDLNCHKSPAATVGSSSLPLTPSPISCSPIPKPEVFPQILSQLQAQLSAFTRDASPHNPIPASQPTSMFNSSVLMTETNSFGAMACQNAAANESQELNQESSEAVYQTISPPFSSAEGCSNTTTVHSVCSNIVFHQNFENALHNGNSNLEEER